MKISVSNIAWENKYLSDYLKLIKNLGCSGVELAPSIIWPEPVDSSLEDRKNFKDKIKKEGLEITGFHALLFSRPDLQLFESTESRKKSINYLLKLIELCHHLGGKQLVFGSPRNRKLCNKKYSICFDQAMEDFYTVSEFGKKYNISGYNYYYEIDWL